MLEKEVIERMVRDACTAEEMYADRPLVCDMACHVKALAFDIETLGNLMAHQARTFDADSKANREGYEKEIARLEAVQEDAIKAMVCGQDRIQQPDTQEPEPMPPSLSYFARLVADILAQAPSYDEVIPKGFAPLYLVRDRIKMDRELFDLLLAESVQAGLLVTQDMPAEYWQVRCVGMKVEAKAA